MSDTKLSRTIASTATLKIANIHSLDLFYTPLEERFERITRIARRALQVPVAAITLLNDDKQWFKSAAGWGISELPREHGICRLTVEENRLVTIGDTSKDSRTAQSPDRRERAALSLRMPAIRSRDEHGNVAGTFCVFDLKPREFNAADRQTVTDLAAMTQRELLSDRLSDAHSELTSKLSIARREAMMDPLTHLWNRRGASVLLKSAFRERRPTRHAAHARAARPRQLQARQRQLRSPNRRRGAAQRREPIDQRRAQQRHRLPHRRRRIPDPHERDRRTRRDRRSRSASGTRSPTPPCRLATGR